MQKSYSGGRKVTVWVQDVLVPALKADAKVGKNSETYADQLAYDVNSDRSQNSPYMMVSLLEPK
jgi:hypothetical protein